MMAALVLIVGSADCTAIVQTPVVALYPGSLVGMLKSIVFVVPTAPFTCDCSCALSDETASVPFETSIASRSDRVESAVVSSAVVFTVIVARSWRSSSISTWTLFRFRGFVVAMRLLMVSLSLDRMG